MTNITHKKESKKQKSPEIRRFVEFMEAEKIDVMDLSLKTGVSDRTISNCIWGDKPLGAQLLRQLLVIFGVSIDWLLAGEGIMFVHQKDNALKTVLDINEASPSFQSEDEKDDEVTPLIPFYQHTDLSQLQDFWHHIALITERSLIQSGAMPNQDYSRLDLYKLAQPIIMQELKHKNLRLSVFE